MSRTLWIAMPLLMLGACNSAAETAANNASAGNLSVSNMGNAASNETGNAAMAAPATDTPTYLAKAGAGDLFEIQSSQAILAKTGNAAIKSFAQMMVDDHGKSTAKLKAAAQNAGITVPAPALDPMQQQALDSIKAASGKDADRAYLDAQRTAHDQALALHRGYAASGDAPALKTAAAEIATVVQHHIDTLSTLNAD